MNRATARETIFAGEGDYAAFERVLAEARERDAHRHTAGTGALYGARFKSFPVREDWHFLKVRRYVERNPLRANLVERAELWPWCSPNKRLAGCDKRLAACGVGEPSAAAMPDEPVPPGAAELLDECPGKSPGKRVGNHLTCGVGGPSAAAVPHEPVPPGAAELLDGWPVPEPKDWLERANAADTVGELEALRRCVRRGRPYGDEDPGKSPGKRVGNHLTCGVGGPSAAAVPHEPVPPGAAELLDEWPVPEPQDWLERVNAADTVAELEALRRCVRRGRPYGDEEWGVRTAEQLGLSASLRPAGRPRKKAQPPSD